MDTNAPQSDEDILAQVEAMAQQKAADLVAAQKAANVAVARKLLELQATSEVDLFAAGDSGGTFRGVFKAPSPELWKKLKSELRGEQQKLVANQNLVVACMVWPAAEVLAAAAAKRPALYDVLGFILQERAGAGQDAYSKG
jgi:hypothetical protein